MSANVFYDNSKKIAFLPILGNLDTDIASILHSLNWKQSNNINLSSVFVVLDDPFTRWARIICNCFFKANHSNLGLNKDNFLDFVLYNKISCANITILQKKIYEESKIPTKSKVYFIKLNSKLGWTLNHLLRNFDVPNQFNNSLQVDHSVDPYITTLKNFLYDDINLPYLNKVFTYLQDDYDFINSIEFYAR